MQRIKAAEKREKVLILLGSTILLIIGLVLILMFYSRSIILLLIGISITILGIKFIYKHLPMINTGEMPFMTILLKEPQRVVWVYAIVTQRMPFGFQVNQTGTMYFKLIDGNEITLTFPASELKNISEMLNYHLPHATFGYTKEREQWYLAHPALLMKE
jgi:hypothetical protein